MNEFLDREKYWPHIVNSKGGGVIGMTGGSRIDDFNTRTLNKSFDNAAKLSHKQPFHQ